MKISPCIQKENKSHRNRNNQEWIVGLDSHGQNFYHRALWLGKYDRKWTDIINTRSSKVHQTVTPKLNDLLMIFITFLSDLSLGEARLPIQIRLFQVINYNQEHLRLANNLWSRSPIIHTASFGIYFADLIFIVSL